MRATLTQKLQFDTGDHLEDELPLRSGCCRCHPLHENGTRSNISHSESHAAGSNSAQRHAHAPSLLAANHTSPVTPISRSLTGIADPAECTTCPSIISQSVPRCLMTNVGPPEVPSPYETRQLLVLTMQSHFGWTTCHTLTSFGLII